MSEWELRERIANIINQGGYTALRVHDMLKLIEEYNKEKKAT